jgi:hypothetical protein
VCLRAPTALAVDPAPNVRVLAVPPVLQAVSLLPGVATASEVMAASADGLSFLKFFPALQAGGIRYHLRGGQLRRLHARIIGCFARLSNTAAQLRRYNQRACNFKL